MPDLEPGSNVPLALQECVSAAEVPGFLSSLSRPAVGGGEEIQALLLKSKMHSCFIRGGEKCIPHGTRLRLVHYFMVYHKFKGKNKKTTHGFFMPSVWLAKLVSSEETVF